MNPITVIRAHVGKIGASLRKAAVPLLVTGLVLLLSTAYVIKRVIYLVGPGEAGVHWSLFTGTEVDRVYGEGIHLFPPWDRFSIYNVRIQEIALELFVLTKRGLQVHLSLSIRYQPQYDMLGVLHQQVGHNYVKTVIIPEIEEVLRETVGDMFSEDIYVTGRTVIIKAFNKAIERVAQRYINVDDVLIKRIILPESVSEAIRFKLTEKHLIEAKAFAVEKARREAERKRIEGEGIRDQLKIIASAIPDGQILTWQGIKATEEIAMSQNAKIIIIGSGENGLPIILNAGAGTTINPAGQNTAGRATINPPGQ
uniref:Regulator of protease activity HflC, stomatin/prohibitin superfamily n=1 Tax=Candidatus Kentrum sp. FM TaxID=2126340 RepID=A0A450SMW0_9GAMM|nr:MAG: Regulator of protease activity HflC, stomatin/prohibitin superfamily [Candidatus Kentron sp. FM]